LRGFFVVGVGPFLLRFVIASEGATCRPLGRDARVRHDGKVAAPADITIEIVETDALSYDGDVLVLKYAQGLYGADAKAAAVAGIDEADLPKPGGYRVIASPSGVAASKLMFVGVAPLRQFGYAEIRDFARRALCSVASEQPDARVIVLTLHGAGYGLDEMEAFDSELAGILDATQERDVPRTLKRVVIAEVAPGRAARMAERLQAVFDGQQTVRPGASMADALDTGSARRFRSVGYDSSQRGHAFVAMPFSDDFDDLFHYAISGAVREVGLLCERIDRQSFVGDVLERLKREIESARLVIADVSNSNPNVCLEVGYAWGCGVPTLLLRSNKAAEPIYDVRGQRCLIYSGIKDAEKQLTDELRGLLA
jgi:hypothetical protein